MLEIIILFVCGKKIAAICNEKNRAAWPWVLMMIFFWYGGAIAGAVVGLIASELSDPRADEPNPVMLFGGIIGGAVLGMVVTFVTVNMLPANEDEYEYDRRRRRYDDDEDDDYRPRRRRSAEDDDRDHDRLRDPDDDRYGRGRRYADEDDRRRDYDR